MPDAEEMDDDLTCTPLTARWCPVHGDCRCRDDGDWTSDMDAPDCPLHSARATHAEVYDRCPLCGTTHYAEMPCYFRPPADYTPPTHCETCQGVIYFHGVIGGFLWGHLTAQSDPHEVVIRPEGYWDVMSGETVYGNPLIHPEFARKHDEGESPKEQS